MLFYRVFFKKGGIYCSILRCQKVSEQQVEFKQEGVQSPHFKSYACLSGRTKELPLENIHRLYCKMTVKSYTGSGTWN